MKRTIWAGITALTIAATFVGVGTASAADDGAGADTSRSERVARACEHQSEILAAIDHRLAETQRRIDWLTERRGTADTAGRTKLVARIDAALAKANDRLVKVQARKDQLIAQAAEHCPTAG